VRILREKEALPMFVFQLSKLKAIFNNSSQFKKLLSCLKLPLRRATSTV
tara:strand:- start:1869 stop:2015 length:147 start_codon:yes stop_codon:yes gene_type:complete